MIRRTRPVRRRGDFIKDVSRLPIDPLGQRPTRKQQVVKTAHCEAAHVVAAFVLTSKLPLAASVEPHAVARLVRIVSPLARVRIVAECSPRAQVRAEHAIMILLAGLIAQRGFAPRSARGWHTHDSYYRALDYALALNNKSRPAAEAHLRWLELRTAALVEQHWPTVSCVARALVELKTIKRKALRDLMSKVERQGDG